MKPGLQYEERSPPPELAGLLRCVWQLIGKPAALGGPRNQPIVPDGCPEIVLNLADPFVQLESGGVWAQQPRSMLVGQLTRPAVVGPSGATRIVGIRFMPWGAARFLGIPLVEVRDAFLPLDSVVSGGMEDLADRLSGRQVESWAETVFDYLRELTPHNAGRPSLSARAVEDISLRRGRISVRALARRLYVSERHLERVMSREVGLPPIVLARILRVQAALRLMLDARQRLLSEVAVQVGYFDQPHFVREFRRLVGCTPSQFQDSEYNLTKHFISAGQTP